MPVRSPFRRPRSVQIAVQESQLLAAIEQNPGSMDFRRPEALPGQIGANQLVGAEQQHPAHAGITPSRGSHESPIGS